MMKAAVVKAVGEPSDIREVEKPEAESGRVAVRIEASGVCRTDFHAAQGDWPVKPAPPFIPGHEGVGVAAEAGAGATNAREDA